MGCGRVRMLSDFTPDDISRYNFTFVDATREYAVFQVDPVRGSQGIKSSMVQVPIGAYRLIESLHGQATGEEPLTITGEEMKGYCGQVPSSVTAPQRTRPRPDYRGLADYKTYFHHSV
jgi:hypothetical protein